MKPEAAQKSEPVSFWELALMVVLVVLSCLGAWVVSHDCLIVLATVFAALAVMIILTPQGKTILRIKGPGISGDIERRS
jgi:hypothetical protein